MIVEVRRLLEDEMRESRKTRALPQTPVTCSHVKAPSHIINCAHPQVRKDRNSRSGCAQPASLLAIVQSSQFFCSL